MYLFFFLVWIFFFRFCFFLKLYLEYAGIFWLFFFLINNEDTDILLVCVCGGCACEAKDHLHETASDDELRYVITERGRFKPIFTLQSMKRTGRESSDVLERGGSHTVLAGTASFTDRLLLRLFQFYVNHWKEEVKANRSPTPFPYQERDFEWHFQCFPLKYLARPAPNRRFLTSPPALAQKQGQTPMFVSSQSPQPNPISYCGN